MSLNISPAEYLKVFFFCNDFKHALCKHTLHRVLRKKEHPYSVIACFFKRNTDFSCFKRKESVRNLYKYSYTVTDFSCCIFSCSVLKFFYYLERIVKNFVVCTSVYIDDCTYTAGIMFIHPSFHFYPSFFLFILMRKASVRMSDIRDSCQEQVLLQHLHTFSLHPCLQELSSGSMKPDRELQSYPQQLLYQLQVS